MEEQLYEVFDRSKIVNCLHQETRQNFKVYDFPNERCRIAQINELKDKENEKTLEVSNPNTKIIYCLSVDNCLIKIKDDQQKCDCILFDDLQLFFVEMKTDAVSTKFETLQDRCENAEKQIIATHKFLNDHNISLNSFKKKGIVCFTQNILTGKTLRINSVSIQSFQRSFLKTHGFSINIANKITFQ